MAAWGNPRQAAWQADHAYRDLTMMRNLGQAIPNEVFSVAGRGFQRRAIPGCTGYTCPPAPGTEDWGTRRLPAEPMDLDAIADQVLASFGMEP